MANGFDLTRTKQMVGRATAPPFVQRPDTAKFATMLGQQGQEFVQQGLQQAPQVRPSGGAGAVNQGDMFQQKAEQVLEQASQIDTTALDEIIEKGEEFAKAGMEEHIGNRIYGAFVHPSIQANQNFWSSPQGQTLIGRLKEIRQQRVAQAQQAQADELRRTQRERQIQEAASRVIEGRGRPTRTGGFSAMPLGVTFPGERIGRSEALFRETVRGGIPLDVAKELRAQIKTSSDRQAALREARRHRMESISEMAQAMPDSVPDDIALELSRMRINGPPQDLLPEEQREWYQRYQRLERAANAFAVQDQHLQRVINQIDTLLPRYIQAREQGLESADALEESLNTALKQISDNESLAALVPTLTSWSKHTQDVIKAGNIAIPPRPDIDPSPEDFDTVPGPNQPPPFLPREITEPVERAARTIKRAVADVPQAAANLKEEAGRQAKRLGRTVLGTQPETAAQVINTPGYGEEIWQWLPPNFDQMQEEQKQQALSFAKLMNRQWGSPDNLPPNFKLPYPVRGPLPPPSAEVKAPAPIGQNKKDQTNKGNTAGRNLMR